MSDKEKNLTLHERGVSFYRAMLLIRRFEERVNRLFGEGRIKGTTHLCIGQEAPAVGIMAALAATDQAVSHHRGHGHALAKGCAPGRVMAEIMGRSAGLCGGRGGSQHMAEPEIGFLGTNGIVGGGIPIAVGAALSAHLLGTGAVVASFFGDGAVNQGAFHEAVNIAALWKLPVLFVCENNGYCMSTRYRQASSAESVAARAAAYRIGAHQADGNDVLALYELARDLVAALRDGAGPQLIEALTWRQCGHSKSDDNEYRDRREEAEWLRRDPLTLLTDKLERAHIAGPAEIAALDRAVELEIDDAVAFATASPWPDPAELGARVFA